METTNYTEYGLILKYPSSVYEPAEDTFLVIQKINLPKKCDTVIEIGGGTGIISLALAKKHPSTRFIITDLSFEATKVIQNNIILNNMRNRIDIICANKLHAIRKSSNKVIIWNPPYLPKDEDAGKLSFNEQIMFFGGKKGYEEVYKLIEDLKNRFSKMVFYTIFSSRAWKKEQLKQILERGFFAEIIAEKAFFFEKLYLVKIQSDKQ